MKGENEGTRQGGGGSAAAPFRFECTVSVDIGAGFLVVQRRVGVGARLGAFVSASCGCKAARENQRGHLHRPQAAFLGEEREKREVAPRE